MVTLPFFAPVGRRADRPRAAAMLGSLVLLLLLALASPAAAQTFPALTGRVVDQANIIPDEREAALSRQLEQLQQATSRQLVIVTLASLEGYEIEDYGYRLGRQWGIGQSEANNGVILIVAPNEHRVRIEVGYGLEPIITDAFASRVINEQIVPRFRESDFPGGIEVGAAALISQLAAPPEQAEQRALEAERARQQQRQRGGGGNGGDGIIVLVVIGFIVLIFIGAVSNAAGGRRRRRVAPWGQPYGTRHDNSDIGWFIAGAVLDGLLRGAARGGGSWGGGGGGSWGGGGGGGFSGGGGSFGGGGASGSW